MFFLLLFACVQGAGERTDPRPLDSTQEMARGRECLPPPLAALLVEWLQAMPTLAHHRLLTTVALERLRDELANGAAFPLAVKRAAYRALGQHQYAVRQLEAVPEPLPPGWAETTARLGVAFEEAEGRAAAMEEPAVVELVACLRGAGKRAIIKMLTHHFD